MMFSALPNVKHLTGYITSASFYLDKKLDFCGPEQRMELYLL